MPKFKIPVTLVVDYVVMADDDAAALDKVRLAMKSASDYANTRELGTIGADNIEAEVGVAQKVTSLYTVEFTVRYRIEDVEAEDESDAEYEVESNWRYMSKDDIDFEIEEVEEQA